MLLYQFSVPMNALIKQCLSYTPL
uniref:Uncharacterized protein n=1 Tax=Arundo donax TaxID=35708 RepID=A0A0A9F9F2_ARUDO